MAGKADDPGPRHEIGGGQDDFQPGGVGLEGMTRQVMQAGGFEFADALLDPGVLAVPQLQTRDLPGHDTSRGVGRAGSNTAADNMDMLLQRKLVMFGPREVLLTSDEPSVRQFLNGRRIGPIGMSEEKDAVTMAEEQAHLQAGQQDGGVEELTGVPPQIQPTPGLPERRGVALHQSRLRVILHTLAVKAQDAIQDSIGRTQPDAGVR